MKKSDFKEFKPVYIESCETIVKQRHCGSFSNIACDDCPFFVQNASNGKLCWKNYKNRCVINEPNAKLVKSAKQYLELYKEEKMFEKKEVFGSWELWKSRKSIFLVSVNSNAIYRFSDDSNGWVDLFEDNKHATIFSAEKMRKDSDINAIMIDFHNFRFPKAQPEKMIDTKHGKVSLSTIDEALEEKFNREE